MIKLFIGGNDIVELVDKANIWLEKNNTEANSTSVHVLHNGDVWLFVTYKLKDIK